MAGAVAVGVDGTLASRFAVDWASREAERLGASLRLVHVSMPTHRTASETEDLVVNELAFARSLPGGRNATVEVLSGDPVRSLAEFTADFDVLAIGTHKTGFLRGRAFGSTGPRLASVAKIPLAVIPAPSGRARSGVVVGIDSTPRSLPAVRIAATAAVSHGCELTVVHARPVSGPSELAAALRLVDVEFPQLTVHTRAVIGAAGEVLVNAGSAAECLYLGGGDSSGESIGPVGFDVLLNIAGPTVLVPLVREQASANSR